MERVLIVDDDPDILHLVSYNLKQAGFEAITADTGRKALETIQRRPPDLVILDLMLPDVDGMEVCRMLRGHESSRLIPIIMLTARGEEIDRVVGFELGADDYVMNPSVPGNSCCASNQSCAAHMPIAPRCFDWERSNFIPSGGNALSARIRSP